ncbi:MAG: hypothetical protein O3C05_01650 [Proteobacteria bacterium]|nr:hypothetical protein [Pseudomonadota bacterium]
MREKANSIIQNALLELNKAISTHAGEITRMQNKIRKLTIENEELKKEMHLISKHPQMEFVQTKQQNKANFIPSGENFIRKDVAREVNLSVSHLKAMLKNHK